MLEFESCCFCVPLKIGCFILGYIQLVADIVLIIMSILGMATGAYINNSHIDDGGVGIALIAVSFILLLFVSILLIFTVLLLVGLHKEKPKLVKAYMIYALTFLIIYIILFIVRSATTPISVYFIIGTIIEILLNTYFLLVIRSQYIKMDGNSFNSA